MARSTLEPCLNDDACFSVVAVPFRLMRSVPYQKVLLEAVLKKKKKSFAADRLHQAKKTYDLSFIQIFSLWGTGEPLARAWGAAVDTQADRGGFWIGGAPSPLGRQSHLQASAGPSDGHFL